MITHMEKKKMDPSFTPHIKVNCRWTKGLNKKGKTSNRKYRKRNNSSGIQMNKESS